MSSFWSVDSDRLVRIFHNNGLRMSLKKAFEVARIIEDLHCQRVVEVENTTWKVAREEADRKVKQAETSAEQKVTDTLRQFQRQADSRFDTIVKTTLWAKDYFTDSELCHKKVWCIKRVREEAPILGLRECKSIIDNLIK